MYVQVLLQTRSPVPLRLRNMSGAGQFEWSSNSLNLASYFPVVDIWKCNLLNLSLKEIHSTHNTRAVLLHRRELTPDFKTHLEWE